MTRPTIRLLLVEDDPSDAELVRLTLAESRGVRFDVTHATRLRTAREHLARGATDLALVDLGLPDAQGMETLEALLAAHPDVPYIVLTGLDDDDLGTWAVQRGAQDFVVKDRPAGDLLARSIRYAIERHAMTARLESAARVARASEARLRHLIGRSAEGILVVGADAGVRFANPAAERMLRCGASALVGAPLPFGVDGVGSQPREVALRRLDGTSFPAEVRVVDLEWEGGPARLVSAFDLSDRKRADRIALAQTVQRAFLPERKEARAGELEICASNALYEDVSGDFYDVVEHEDGRVTVAVGDVTGHGYGPALLMAQGRAYLRAYAKTLPDLPAVVAGMNDALAADMAEGRFMSLFAATLRPETGALSWCNAGHVPALLLRAASGEIELLEATGLVLGVVPGGAYPAGGTVALEPEDVLLLCSDGATEAVDAHGVAFGMGRIATVLRGAAPAGAKAVLEALATSIAAWTAGRPVEDDLTLLAVRRAPRPVRVDDAQARRSRAARALPRPPDLPTGDARGPTPRAAVLPLPCRTDGPTP